MNNRDLVSRIATILKSNSKDSVIRRRLILKTAENKAKFLISQKLNDRSLYREQNLYSYVECLEMVDDNIIKCPIIEFRSCRNLKKSKNKLPDLIHSRYGHSIKTVTSVDGLHIFEPITPFQFVNNKKRTFSEKRDYFYVKDNYLYLPDSDVQSVNVELITQDLYDLEECSSCKNSECKSKWDYEFICPDKLLEIVINETVKELTLTKEIVEDVNPNLNPNG